jgi:hypothetical protein
MPNDVQDTRYLLIQVKSELGDEQKAQLEQLGVELIQFVPDATYLCRFDVGELNRVRSLEFVSWANPFMKPRKARDR